MGLMALLVLVAGYGLQAQDKTKKAALPNEQAWLQKFVGKWSGTAISTDDKNQSVKLLTHMSYSSVADGNGVYGVEYFDDPKAGKLRASYLMGYDPYDKKIHFYAVDNLGTCHDHDCTWKSPDTFYLENNSMREGKAYKEEITIVFKDKNTIDFSETVYFGGIVIETDKGTLRKEK